MRVAIMADETGWHTRQLQAALRARGVASRCVDLADCRIDTTAAWHGLAIPGFGRVYYEVPGMPPADHYRVTVWAYERIQAPDGGFVIR